MAKSIDDATEAPNGEARRRRMLLVVIEPQRSQPDASGARASD